MTFVKTWLVPRVAFWAMWTAWLCCLQYLLLPRFAFSPGEPAPGYWVQLMVMGPPLLLTWIGSRQARNPLDTPSALFSKGAAVSCVLGVFANFYLMREIGQGVELLIPGLLLSGYLAVRGTDVKQVDVKHGELFEGVQNIARRTGVQVHRVLVFTSPRNTAAAFAHRMGNILLSDRLLRVLSQRETDAVIAHEAAHLRPLHRMVVAALPVAAAGTVLTGFFWPGVKLSAPVWPLTVVLLWRALRRLLEFDADASSVRATGDPESLITALTRISHAGGLPLHWGRMAGLFMAHPPTTRRFRAIARTAGINGARVEELVSIAGAVPPLPGYASPFGQPKPQDTDILSVHRDRLQARIAVLLKVAPVVAGVAMTGVGRSWPLEFAGTVALTAAWIPGAMLFYWIAYEVLVGSERHRLRSQLPGADRAGGYFVGLSTAGEPREFESTYHCDLGTAAADGGNLKFTGARYSFSIARSRVQRIWMAGGPPHWTPRKMVCVEYRLAGGKLAIVSMQPLERWFWPGTSRAASQMLRDLTAWRENAALRESSTVAPPQTPGAPVRRMPLGIIWKSVRLFCLISWGIGWLIASFSVDLSGTFLTFGAPLVTGALVVFALAPHLEWRRVRPAAPNQSAAHPSSTRAAGPGPALKGASPTQRQSSVT